MNLQEMTATILSSSVFLCASGVVLFLLNRFYFDAQKWISKFIVRPVYRICIAMAIIGAILGLSLNVYVGMVS